METVSVTAKDGTTVEIPPTSQPSEATRLIARSWQYGCGGAANTKPGPPSPTRPR